MTDKAKVSTKQPSDKAKTYRIKDGAPDHYFPAYGIVKAGAVIRYDGKPGMWLEEVKPQKAEKAQKAEEPQKAEELVQ